MSGAEDGLTVGYEVWSDNSDMPISKDFQGTLVFCLRPFF